MLITEDLLLNSVVVTQTCWSQRKIFTELDQNEYWVKHFQNTTLHQVSVQKQLAEGRINTAKPYWINREKDNCLSGSCLGCPEKDRCCYESKDFSVWPINGLAFIVMKQMNLMFASRPYAVLLQIIRRMGDFLLRANKCGCRFILYILYYTIIYRFVFAGIVCKHRCSVLII